MSIQPTVISTPALSSLPDITMEIENMVNGSSRESTLTCDDITHVYNVAEAVIYSLCCAIGIVLSVFGYRIYRVCLAGVAFLFITFTVYLVCITHAPTLSLGATIAIAAILGVIVAILSAAVHYIGQFITGSQIGIALTIVIFIIVEQVTRVPSLWIPIGILITLWLISGVVSLKYPKTMIIVGSAVSGSALISSCMDYFADSAIMVEYSHHVVRAAPRHAIHCWFSWLIFVTWPVIFVCTLLVQMRVTAHKYDHSVEHERLRERRAQKLNLQKLREEADHDEQQSHYRHLYQVRRVHGDVISQEFLKDLQEQNEKRKSFSPPPSVPTTLTTTVTLSGDGIFSPESTQTTLSHVP